MAILPRYVLRLFLPIFGVSAVLFMGVLMMNQFLRLFSLAMMKGVPAWWILACFSYLLPTLAALAVPMSFLVAAMVALGQMNDGGEIMALRASGFSYHEIVRPLLYLSITLSALLLVVNHALGPDGYHSFKKRTTAAAQKIARVDLRPRSFTRLGPWRLYARGVDPKTGFLDGIYLVKPGTAGGMRVNAKTGSLSSDPVRGITLELHNGQIQLPSKAPTLFTSGRFERYSIFVPLTATAAPRELEIQETNTWRLHSKAVDPATTQDRRREYRVEMVARTAVSLSPFVFFCVGVPLGMAKRRTRGADFAASLGVMFLFYGLLVMGVSLGRRHEALALLAPWLCDGVGILAGFFLTKKATAQ